MKNLTSMNQSALCPIIRLTCIEIELNLVKKLVGLAWLMVKYIQPIAYYLLLDTVAINICKGFIMGFSIIYFDRADDF